MTKETVFTEATQEAADQDLSRLTRRKFLMLNGASLASFTLLGVLGSSGTASAAWCLFWIWDTGCGGVYPDRGCSPMYHDTSCGEPLAGLDGWTDPDQHCDPTDYNCNKKTVGDRIDNDGPGLIFKQQSVDSAGGDVSTDDGTIVWTIPAGAFTSSTVVTLSLLPSNFADIDWSPPNLGLWDICELLPDGAIYQSGHSATLTFQYPSSRNPDKMGIYRYDNLAGTWSKLETAEVDRDAYTISALTDHNSVYGVLEDLSSVAVPASSNWSVFALGGIGLVLLREFFKRAMASESIE